MSPRGVFVTGTDTGVGKTWIAAGLLLALRARGLRVAGMKPVSCGCETGADGARHADALLLRSCSSDPALAYEAVNPYAFSSPVAPHLAAAATGVKIDTARIRDAFARLTRQADCVVVEGAGGWLVPLDGERTMADLARTLELPVVLVVGMRLGCLNHALLSAAAIRGAGLTLAGWVANTIDPDMLLIEENIAALHSRIPAPLLGTVPALPAFDGERIGKCLDTGALPPPRNP